jgi:hypothetical protein
MTDDFDDYVEEDDYIEDDEYISESESENLDEKSDIDDDVSEVYQPKIEKKSDFKNKSRNIIIVPSDERITDNRLHKNEASFILSIRAKQIADSSTHFAKDCNLNNAISIAYQELYTHRCPLKLRRSVGVNSKGDIIVEEWDVKTMVLPNIPIL